MAKYPIPSPVFDTLEHIDDERSPIGGPKYTARDYKLALEFLKQYNGNKATFNSYRREVERFLQWSWLIQEKSILDLRRNDIEAYVKFCLKPRKSWIGLKKVARFKTIDSLRVPNPEWRPFVVTLNKVEVKAGKSPTKDDYSLSQKATKEIFVVLGSFYSYLLTEGITEINPVATIRQKSKFIRQSQTAPKIPRLSETQWLAVVEAAESMADKSPEMHERTLFMISALYLMYLRISELVASERWTPLMKHFYQDSNRNWWFTTVGKGNKERDISVSDGMLKALKRWRKHLDLTPALPNPQDNHPLIPKAKGNGGITSVRWVNKIIQSCFDEAVEMLNSRGLSEEAAHLSSATVHWLRHTGISDDINKRNRPVAHVRDDAGHSTIATTDRYNDITLKERHASAKKKQVR